jgi:hypothetical protein
MYVIKMTLFPEITVNKIMKHVADIEGHYPILVVVL